MPHQIVLYNQPGCHLCEIVEQILQGLRRDFEFSVEKVDISADPTLLKQYGAKIPVVVIDQRKVLAAPIHVADLRAALRERPRMLL
jgi:glutaredoxin